MEAYLERVIIMNSHIGEMYKRMAIANLRTAIRVKEEIMDRSLWFLNPANWFRVMYLNDVIKSCYEYLKRSQVISPPRVHVMKEEV